MKRNRRREFDEQVKELTKEGLTDQEIADELGMALTSVSDARKRAGLKLNPAKPGPKPKDK